MRNERNRSCLRLFRQVVLCTACFVAVGIEVQAAPQLPAGSPPPAKTSQPAPDPGLELKTAQTVPLKYYVSLPGGWNTERNWPVVIAIEGSGHNFVQNGNGFVRARKARPFILVIPCVSSDGNNPADAAGILAIANEVRQAYHGQPKFFLTGFSSGGHGLWQIVFAHPELLAGAAPAAAAYTGRGIAAISTDPSRVSLPVHAFVGDKDPTLRFRLQQWKTVEAFARANGYTNLQQTLVPGATHQPLASQVLDFFASLLPESVNTSAPAK